MEVTRSNFTKILDGFEAELKSSKIVAIDLELSGLQTTQNFKSSLFDSGCARYTKIRKKSVGIIATQVGLSIYQYDRSSNTYKSSAYTFHLSPQAIGSVQQMCTFQGAVFGFLKDNQFDFNKFAYEGISYLNHSEGVALKKDIDENLLESDLDLYQVDKIDSILLDIHTWIKSGDESYSILETNRTIQINLLNICHRLFPDLIINFDESGMNVTRKKDNGDLIKSMPIEEMQFRHANGFTNIVELLHKYKKPLVLHNGLMDLMIIYNQFIDTLPTSYDTFKNHINEFFPEVYDTKFIFNGMRSLVRNEKAAENSSLENIYTMFSESPSAANFGLYAPRINLNEGFANSPWFHHAGWDAYCTGYCFLRLCHGVACENIGTSRILSSAEHLKAITKFSNKIYLSRGAQPYVCLDKTDPPCHRPKYLYIETMKRKPINMAELAKLIGRSESADIKKYNDSSALVAVINNHGFRRIFESLKKNDEFHIAKFNYIKHSRQARMALWTSFILSSGSLIAFVFYKMR